MRAIYSALPADWLMYIEHKLFEPAFYATTIADWGTSFTCATEPGPKAKCLVDLGHYAPNTNIEMIVASLAQFGKLGGFHFNDSKYGDDDLDSGSINPFQPKRRSCARQRPAPAAAASSEPRRQRDDDPDALRAQAGPQAKPGSDPGGSDPRPNATAMFVVLAYALAFAHIFEISC
jgi:hypothetical protein